MVKSRNLFVALLAFIAVGMLSTAHAEEKHVHGGKGPNGGALVEVGDADDHHVEIVHDDKTGTLTVYCLLADQKSPYTPKEAPKLNLSSKAGNKQLEMKGKDSKWEATDDVLKEEPNGRIVVVLPDGKKYNVKIEDEHKK
jgi:hypothetical protein